MRTIEQSSGFRKDYKRAFKGRHRKQLDEVLLPVLKALENDAPLELRYRDHDLSGVWRDTGSATSSPISC